MKYVIIGNGPAGIYAAKKIRQNNSTAEIEIFSDSPHHFYSKPKLTTQYLAGDYPLEKLLIFKPDWYPEQNIKINLKTKISQLNPDSHELATESGQKISYDKLLIATGSTPFRLPIAGADSDKVFTIRTIEDVDQIKALIPQSQKAAIIGGGLLGLETANSANVSNLEINIIEYFDYLLPRQLDKEGSTILKELLEAKGLKFHLGISVAAIEDTNNQKLLKIKDGSELLVDFVIISTGIKPAIEIAKDAGINTNKGIIVNDYLETNIKDIYAAGDCAEHKGKIYGLWSAAMEQGEAAALTMMEKKTAYSGTTVSTMLKVADIELASLGEIDMEKNPKLKTIKGAVTENLKYQKLFLEENKVKGAIFIGSIKPAQKIKKMIKEQTIIANPNTILEG